MESYIDRVADPAAGAYYMEQMTNEIANQTWEMFKQIRRNAENKIIIYN
jgi:methylmalonyl-CoA mutase